jgi:nucleotide-binding universal stress UspA family protein
VKVLVALDSDESATTIVRTLGTWAVETKAEVHLLTVLLPSHIRGTEAGDNPRHEMTPSAAAGGQLLHLGEPPHRVSESKSQAVSRALAEVRDKHASLASQFLPGVDFTSHQVPDDHVAPTILRIGTEIGADLLALGTHGRTGLSHVLMGSVAENVIRNASVPVLVVGPKALVRGG